MIFYLITGGSAARDPDCWLEYVEFWMTRIDFIQVREPELSARQLARVVKRLCSAERKARILVNDRTDVARACGADGVHLRDGSVGANEIRKIAPPEFIVSVACHDLTGVKAAAALGADYILLAPIFKPISKPATRPPLGFEVLREAAGSVSVPVIALGGITPSNAVPCMEAGAAGIAGIDFFGGQ